MDYGVGRYPVGNATQRRQYNNSYKKSAQSTSYLQESKAELKHFKSLNPRFSSIPALIITGAWELMGLGFAGIKKVGKLLF